jgi:hypothetical protein
MRATEFFDKLSEDDREHLNMLDRAEYLQQTAEFDAAYAQGKCFMCGDVLDHAKFKKNDFPKVFGVYDYHNIAAFLRWCANKEQPLRGINDLEAEKLARKVLSYSVR